MVVDHRERKYGITFRDDYQFVDRYSVPFHSVVAFDTETTGLHPQKGDEVVMSSVACDKAGTRYVAASTSLEEFKRICEDETITKVFHNLKFDLEMAKRHGINVRGPVHCTMLMAHVLDENRKIALKNLFVTELQRPADEEAALKAYMRKNKLSAYSQVEHDLLAQYACADVDGTLDIFNRYYPRILGDATLLRVYEYELAMAHVLVDVEFVGYAVNTDLLQRAHHESNKMLSEIDERIREECPTLTWNKDISSKKIYGELCIKRGHRPLAYTARGNPSYSSEALRQTDDPLAQLLADRAEVSSLKSTFIDGLLARIHEGVLYTDLKQVGTVTGRFSSSPNLQNIPTHLPAHLPWWCRIRQFFVPRKGYKNIHFDYRSQEFRIFAHYTRDPDLIEIAQGDAHTGVAKLLFGTDKIEKWMRTLAKTLNFCILYGGGKGAVAASMAFPAGGHPITPEMAYDILKHQGVNLLPFKSYTKMEEVLHQKKRLQVHELVLKLAEVLRTKYYKTFPAVTAFSSDCTRAIMRRGYCKMYYGRRRRLKMKEAYKAMNSVIQGTAAEMMKHAMIGVHTMLKKNGWLGNGADILLTVHDEMVLQIREDLVATIIPLVVEIMKTPFPDDLPPLRVPMEVDVEVEDGSWDVVKEYDYAA